MTERQARTLAAVSLMVSLWLSASEVAAQRLLGPRDWEFRRGADLAGTWDVLYPPTGLVGASFFLPDKAWPPDGRIIQAGTFDGSGDVVEFVDLNLEGIDATGMTARLVRQTADEAGKSAYREMLFYNTKAFPDPTSRRLFALVGASNDKTRKEIKTFRLPPPPTVYELSIGAQLPGIPLRLTASGAAVVATLIH